MAMKQVAQMSFEGALMSSRSGAGPLDRLDRLVTWHRFEKQIGHLSDEASPGHPGWPSLVLFKALLLQALYGLSDRELEEALEDRLSFRRFVGLSLERDVPNQAVLNRFRSRLITEGLQEQLFADVGAVLATASAGEVDRRGWPAHSTSISEERVVETARKLATGRRFCLGSAWRLKAAKAVRSASPLLD
jgi:transposase, IS5 family